MLYLTCAQCIVKLTSVYVKPSGCTSDGLACITLDVIPAETTVECILDYISETGQDMDETEKVSMLRRRCSICITCICAVLLMSFSR